jgi:hypothetical protein
VDKNRNKYKVAKTIDGSSQAQEIKRLVIESKKYISTLLTEEQRMIQQLFNF